MRFKTFISEQTRKPEHTHAVTRGGNVVSYHTSSKSAHKKADSLDNKYGSTVHSVKLLESEIYEMIPYALSAANAEHARQRKAKEEEEKRRAKEQLDKDSEDTGNPFANWKPVKESHVKVGQHVKFNEPVAGTTRHSRKPMSFDGGKVVQVTPTHAIVRPQAWHGDEGLDVHVPHKNIKEAIVEGGNSGKPYDNNADLNSKSNTELQSLHKFWKTRIEKDPNHSRAKDQLAKIKAILAGKIGKKIREEVENFKVGDKVSIHAPDDLDWHERKGELISTSDDGHVVKLNDGTRLSAANHQIKKIDEGMLDDYIEGKIAKHHANKHNPEINAAHADAAEVTKKMKPFNKKIEQIKKRVSYKDKTHKNYAKTRADLKDASAAIQPLSAERSKHYDRIRDARNKRDSNTDSDVETYHKWGVVGLGAKKLKQKLTKEEVELDEGLVSAIKRAFTPKPKTPDQAIADLRKKTKERTQQNLGPAAVRKPKQYTTRLPDAGRKPEPRSEYTANREMTRENYAIAAKQSQSFKTFRGGIKGKGTGTRRTHTNQVADHVKIYKESTND